MATSCYDINRLKQFQADQGDNYRQFGQGPSHNPDPDTEIIYDEEDDDPMSEEDSR